MSIISVFYYLSVSEGWRQVGQFTQTPSGCPWKWQIARLTVPGPRPLEGNGLLYLDWKSIKWVHSQSSPPHQLESGEGWPRGSSGKNPKPSRVRQTRPENGVHFAFRFRNVQGEFPRQLPDRVRCIFSAWSKTPLGLIASHFTADKAKGSL